MTHPATARALVHLALVTVACIAAVVVWAHARPEAGVPLPEGLNLHTAALPAQHGC